MLELDEYKIGDTYNPLLGGKPRHWAITERAACLLDMAHSYKVRLHFHSALKITVEYGNNRVVIEGEPDEVLLATIELADRTGNGFSEIQKQRLRLIDNDRVMVSRSRSRSLRTD